MSAFDDQCLAAHHAGETFLLHPQRVMYWPAKKILFAADVHVGKEHTFGRHGIGIPGGISESTLRTLFALGRDSGAQELVVLGDFMHAIPHGNEHWLRVLSDLLDQHPQLRVSVVAGNHDRKAGQQLTDQRVSWHASSRIIDGLVLQHEPGHDDRGFVLSGHVHPVFRLGAARRGGIRAPVFWFTAHYAVLPAFGEFTGGEVIKPDRKTDTLYMTGPDCVIPIPVPLRC